MRAAITAIAWGLAIAYAANLACGSLFLMSTDYAAPLSALRKLRALEAPVDWIILGDSTAGNSTRAEFLCPRLGVTCLELSTVADFSIVENAWLLELYLMRFPPPSRVLMVESFGTYGVEPAPDILAKGLEVGWGDLGGLEPFGFARYTRAWWLWLGCRVAPAYFMGQEIAEAIFMRRVSWEHHPAVNTHHWREAGYQPLAPANREALKTIARLARTRRFAVDIIPAPVSKRILAEPKDAAIYDDAAAAVDSFCRLHPEISLIRGLPKSYPQAMMKNGRSLIHSGPRAGDHFSLRLLRHYRARLKT